MSAGTLVFVFGGGAAALALWVHVRFPRMCPATLGRTLVHVGISLVVAHVLVRLLARLAPDGGVAGVMVLLFAIALPALVYCFLTSIWIIAVLQGALRHR
jgi:hypothetical protein